jgi:hypothetical protein
MAFASITKPGLSVIAVLVAILWGCFVAERLIVQRANREMTRALKRPVRTPARRPGTLPHPFRIETSERIGSLGRYPTT